MVPLGTRASLTQEERKDLSKRVPTGKRRGENISIIPLALGPPTVQGWDEVVLDTPSYTSFCC